VALSVPSGVRLMGVGPRGLTIFRGVLHVLSASLSSIATSTGIILADVGSYLNSVISSLASAL
jgi:hypothetical protein